MVTRGKYNFETYVSEIDGGDVKSFQLPKATKTGTTICGLLFKDGVVLGADTRSTDGSMVADKDCEKIHFIANQIYCCGAGTAADLFGVTRMVESDIELHRLEADLDRPPFAMVKTILKRHLFQYQGHVSAALVLGGCDNNGFHLSTIAPHGSSDTLPFAAMGSGSLAAMAVLEARYKADLSEDEAKKLVRDAIRGGVFNDLGSGSNVDLCVIKNDKVDYLRSYEVANIRGAKQGSYKFPVGTTAVLKASRIPIEVVSTEIQRETPMEE